MRTTQLKLLVTGFTEFQQFDRNPSGDIAEVVDGKIWKGYKVKGLKLPVSWSDGWGLLQKTIEKFEPDAWLGFGLSPDPFIRLERIARNQADQFRDVFGNFPDQNPSGEILPGYVSELPSTLPLDWLRKQLLVRNFATLGNYPLEVRYSDDAGAYLCNYVFYRMRTEFEHKIPVCGFIHVPPYSMPDIPGSPSDSDIIEAGVFMVDSLIDWLVERVIPNHP